MKLTFRWYGEDDPVTLEKIRQIPNMQGIVSAIYNIPAGEAWPKEKILKLKKSIEDLGLKLEVIESVPVHEDIKLGLPTRDHYINNYIETIKNLGESDVNAVCYNFMPVFDWVRSTLNKRMEDGSITLAFDNEKITSSDPINDGFDLPGWGAMYSKEEMRRLLKQYRDISEEDLWNHLAYFLEKVIPVGEKYDVKMAAHPDDPPWSVFGLPRIVTNHTNLERLVNIVDSPSNELTLCTGSLGSNPDNDVIDIVKNFSKKGKLHFLHFRNIKTNGEHSFEETAHFSKQGSLNMFEILKAAVQSGFDGPIRPDHGRMIWGEKGNPGYGLYDRALGCSYINGLLEAINNYEMIE